MSGSEVTCVAVNLTGMEPLNRRLVPNRKKLGSHAVSPLSSYAGNYQLGADGVNYFFALSEACTRFPVNSFWIQTAVHGAVWGGLTHQQEHRKAGGCHSSGLG